TLWVQRLAKILTLLSKYLLEVVPGKREGKYLKATPVFMLVMVMQVMRVHRAMVHLIVRQFIQNIQGGKNEENLEIIKWSHSVKYRWM
ncbi:hypothetical protein, partial [Bartonella sp. AA1HLJMS]|uniref:hypothetical protein n=1 Tax=Bartonella sp. AA1HLJMS TaxID=3243424 RepID=UPI0035D10C50